MLLITKAMCEAVLKCVEREITEKFPKFLSSQISKEYMDDRHVVCFYT